MAFSRFLGTGACVAVVFGSLVGCASAQSSGEKDDVDAFESELKVASPQSLGSISNNQTKSHHYTGSPKYRAYSFTAEGGDEVTVDVKSSDGDAMGWITDTSNNILASNDDASSSTFDSKVKYTVPSSVSSKTYRVAFREYDYDVADFTVKLSIKSKATSCKYGGDTYSPGDSFPSIDGCNTCNCSSTGTVGCTKKACVSCNPVNEPWRDYIGTPAQCMTIRYTCPSGWSSFQNACGCGCQH